LQWSKSLELYSRTYVLVHHEVTHAGTLLGPGL
jgi:hypothetical protein